MENMYIYQPTTANMQNQQEQKEKEMPNFHCMLETKESFLDVLARQVMVYDFLGDNAFLNAESNAIYTTSVHGRVYQMTATHMKHS